MQTLTDISQKKASKSSIYKDRGNEVCLIMGAPIQEVITLKIVERLITQRDSFTLEEYPLSVTYREYYLGEELIGKTIQDTPSPWSFKGEPPYKPALSDRGLKIISKSQGQIVGLGLEGAVWASGVQIKPSQIEKTRKLLREALPHYKGAFDLYLFCFLQDA